MPPRYVYWTILIDGKATAFRAREREELLQTVAARISACLRAGDVVARFGGDEFIVLLDDAARDDVAQVAHKLLRAIELPVDAEGRDLSVTPSVGIALFPHDGATPTELIKNADTAMYIAKSRGRANCQFFDPNVTREMEEAYLRDLEWSVRIDPAVYASRPLIGRLAENACRLFSPVL